jgi:hypothetical protein
MSTEQLFAMVFALSMFSGVFMMYLAMRQRQLRLEMQHRERMAMIERGQVPLDPPRSSRAQLAAPAGGTRSITLGIIVIAIGLGMMSIVGIAADAASVGVGVGGAIVILGAAFIASGVLKRQQGQSSGLSSSPAPVDRVEP